MNLVFKSIDWFLYGRDAHHETVESYSHLQSNHNKTVQNHRDYPWSSPAFLKLLFSLYLKYIHEWLHLGIRNFSHICSDIPQHSHDDFIFVIQHYFYKHCNYLKEHPGLNECPLRISAPLHSWKIWWASWLKWVPPLNKERALIWKFPSVRYSLFFTIRKFTFRKIFRKSR